SGVLLNLHERAYFRVVSNLTAVEINEFRQLDAFSQPHVGSDAVVVVHSWMAFPRSFNDWSAASSILTTRNPATPSLNGTRLFVMQSTKYSSSTFRASVCSILGAQISPERYLTSKS